MRSTRFERRRRRPGRIWLVFVLLVALLVYFRPYHWRAKPAQRRDAPLEAHEAFLDVGASVSSPAKAPKARRSSQLPNAISMRKATSAPKARRSSHDVRDWRTPRDEPHFSWGLDELVETKAEEFETPPPSPPSPSPPSPSPPRPSCASRRLVVVLCRWNRSLDHMVYLSQMFDEVEHVALAAPGARVDFDPLDLCTLTMVSHSALDSCKGKGSDEFLELAARMKRDFPVVDVPADRRSRWIDEVGWFASATTSLTDGTRVRPLIFKRDVGEMMAYATRVRHAKREEYDFAYDRGLEHPKLAKGGGLLVHFLNGYDFTNCPQWKPPTVGERWIDGVAWKPDVDYQRVLAGKSGHMVTVSGSVWKHMYIGDHLLRVYFCWLVNRVDDEGTHPCHSVSTRGGRSRLFFSYDHLANGRKGCPGKPVDSPDCYRKYKFVLAAENVLYPGHVTEKLLLAAKAQAIPVYFGAPDVFDYRINPERIVYCPVDTLLVDRLRVRQRDASDAIGNATRALSALHVEGKDDTFRSVALELMEELHATTLTAAFEDCLAEIDRLASDDAAYLAKLKQPLFVDNDFTNTHWDGSRLVDATRTVLNALRFPPSASSRTV